MATQWKTNRAADQDRRRQRNKEILDHSRLFLKLDATYLVALGATVTFLKFNTQTIFYQYGTYSVISLSFLLLVLIDVFVYQHLLKIWMEIPGAKSEDTRFSGIMRAVTASQPFIHFIFLTMVLSFSQGFASGRVAIIDQLEAKARIQSLVEDFLGETGSLPTSLSQLKQGQYLQDAIDTLKGEKIQISKPKDAKYLITFSGPDGIFGTSDDDTLLPYHQLRDFVDRQKGNKLAPSR